MVPLKIRGRTHASPGEKAEILDEQFSLEFTKEDMSSLPSAGNSSYPRTPGPNIRVEGVSKILNGLSPNKASGPDQIFVQILEGNAHRNLPLLTLIYQASVEQGQIPKEWKTVDVLPALKKGTKAKPPTIDQSELQRCRAYHSQPYAYCCSNYALTSKQANLDIALDCNLFIEPIATV